jgi:phosphatidylserine/phosphatidylglycerophosphate/cardiolipin synthase-like enzyme
VRRLIITELSIFRPQEKPMRIRNSNGSFSVHAIAGTYVVMFGFNLKKADCPGLLGFSIHRTDHTENEAYFLEGQKVFEETDPDFPAGSTYSTKTQPIQSFQWADYSAKPGHSYTYLINALKGSPKTLASVSEVSVDITTERPAAEGHSVYFNRGVAGSQAYTKRFGNRPPRENDDTDDAWAWLSRGLYEAMTAFIADGAGPGRSYRIAAYEFRHEPFLRVIKAASEKGADVRIVFDARTDPPSDGNMQAIAHVGIGPLTKGRVSGKSNIAHNKFIVRIDDGVPSAIWTGGTNFSAGGIYGHSNVAHVVEDKIIAQRYLDYWNLLSEDLPNAKLEPKLDLLTPLPAGGNLPDGITPVFSPRGSLDALTWYASLASSARSGLFMTFAFGINDIFQDVYQNAAAPLRFALLEKKTRSMEKGPERLAEEAKIDALRRKNENVFAIGSLIPNNKLNGWLKETLSGLNSNVKFIHNKFMLVDPLSDDPIVICGSANFSVNSTTGNDENMLAIRGNRRVADIYLGEYMRLYNHHAFRESLTFRKPGDRPKFLRTDNWWSAFFDGSSRDARRVFFA